MGRHGLRPHGVFRVGRLRVSWTVLALCGLVVAVIGLGSWWWSQRSITDPIDADPVSAAATVLSSPSCLDAGRTIVRVSGTESDTDSVLDGCGFIVGQRISVEYRAGHPEEVRLAGTTRSGNNSPARTIIPITILVAGLAAAWGLVAAGRAWSKSSRPGSVSVAQLRARIRGAGSVTGEDPAATDDRDLAPPRTGASPPGDR